MICRDAAAVLASAAPEGAPGDAPGGAPVAAVRLVCAGLRSLLRVDFVAMSRHRAVRGPGPMEREVAAFAGGFSEDDRKRIADLTSDANWQLPPLDALLREPGAVATGAASEIGLGELRPRSRDVYLGFLHEFRVGDTLRSRSFDLGQPGYVGVINTIRGPRAALHSGRDRAVLHAANMAIGPWLWPLLRPVFGRMAMGDAAGLGAGEARRQRVRAVDAAWERCRERAIGRAIEVRDGVDPWAWG